MDEAIKELKKILDETDNIVFFGGAGVSTESGVPDFRSEDGLYHQHYKYPPEQMLSHTFYRKMSGHQRWRGMVVCDRRECWS